MWLHRSDSSDRTWNVSSIFWDKIVLPAEGRPSTSGQVTSKWKLRRDDLLKISTKNHTQSYFICTAAVLKADLSETFVPPAGKKLKGHKGWCDSAINEYQCWCCSHCSRGKQRELFPMCAPLSPHASIPISCNYPHWEAGRADLEEKGLNVRSYECKMWFFGSSRLNWWWKMNAYFFLKIVEHQQQKRQQEERRSGGQRQRGKK